MNNARRSYQFDLNYLIGRYCNAFIDALRDEGIATNNIDLSDMLFQDKIRLALIGFIKEYTVSRIIRFQPKSIDYYNALARLLIYCNVNPEDDFVSMDVTYSQYTNTDPNRRNVLYSIAQNIHCHFVDVFPNYFHVEMVDKWNEWDVAILDSAVRFVLLGDYRIRRYEELVRYGVITE